MSQTDRRTFLRNAGLTALAGAVASSTSLGAAEASAAAFAADPKVGEKFDFDTPYSRVLSLPQPPLGRYSQSSSLKSGSNACLSGATA